MVLFKDAKKAFDRLNKEYQDKLNELKNKSSGQPPNNNQDKLKENQL